MTDFKVGSLYNFDTRAPAHLGQTFENALLTGIVSYSIAVSMDNIDYKQASVAPYLDPTVSKDPTKYQYLIFQTQAGSTIVLATVWIAESTIVEAQTQSITVVIDNATLDDGLKIKGILGLAGYKRVTITAS